VALVASLLPAICRAQAAAEPPAKATESKSQEETKPQAPAAANDDSLDKKYLADVKEKPAKRYFRFEFKQHPAIRMGKWFRMDFRLRFQHDFRIFDPEVSTDEGELANIRKFRVGIQGYVTKNFEYEIEREIRNEVGDLLNLRTRALRGS